MMRGSGKMEEGLYEINERIERDEGELREVKEGLWETNEGI